MKEIEVKEENIRPAEKEGKDSVQDEGEAGDADLPWTSEACMARMLEVHEAVQLVSQVYSLLTATFSPRLSK